MKTPSLFEQLENHSLVGAKADLARARARQSALAGYQTPEEVVDALQRRPAPAHPKNPLVGALLAETKAGARSLGEVLLRGFLPQLLDLRHEAEELVDDTDALETLLVEAFVVAVAGYGGEEAEPDPTRYLMRACHRHFVALARDLGLEEDRIGPAGLRLAEPATGLLADQALATGGPVEVEDEPGAFKDSASELLVSLVGDRIPAERLALVVATVIHGEKVTEYVRRRFPRVRGRARVQLCSRLRGQRYRAMHQVRRVLSAWRKDPLGGCA